VAAALTQICSDACEPTQRHPGYDVDAVDVTVPSSDRWTLRVWLEDAAGNHNPASAQEIELLADTTPPSVRLLDRTASEPGALYVEASDGLSGIALSELEVRRDGNQLWHSVPVAATQRGFVGVVDDELLPRGRYRVRARVSDRAGNEETATSDPLGLPFRVATHIRVGHRKRVKVQGIGGRRARRILVKRPTARFGRPVVLHGRLSAPGGNPLADRDVNVAERSSDAESVWQPVATVRTDQRGRFRFKARPGASRQLQFRFGGTPTVRGTSSIVQLRVLAASTLGVSQAKVVNGEQVMFRGIVQGELPPAGKLVQLQVFSRGTWLSFATPRADQRGKWQHAYRFTATRGVTRYRFRARLPRETGFPYAPGTSRRVTVKVIGI
jgi:hypothetical protein